MQYTVVAVPMHMTSDARQVLRKELKDAGFYLLAISPRQALIASEHGFDIGVEEFTAHTILFIEMNGASLNMAILLNEYSTVDTIAYVALPELGEDAFAIQMIHTVTEESANHIDLAAVSAIRQSRNIPLGAIEQTVFDATTYGPNQLNSTIIEELNEQHHKSIQRQLENFLIEHTVLEDPHNGSPWKPLRSDLNELALSGDGSERVIASIRRVIADSAILRQLRVLDNGGVPAVRTGAVGAAMNGQRRVVVEDGYEPDYIVHEEL